MSPRLWALILICVAIAAVALKYMAPESAEQHFAQTRGTVDMESLKKQARAYDEREREHQKSNLAAQNARAKPDGTAEPATPTAPATPLAAVPDAKARAKSAATFAAIPDTVLKKPAAPDTTARIQFSSGENFGRTIYLRFSDQVVQMRLNKNLSDEEVLRVSSLFEKACLVQNTERSSEEPRTSSCFLKIVATDLPNPQSNLRLYCGDESDGCLTKSNEVVAKIAPFNGARAIASVVSLYDVKPVSHQSAGRRGSATPKIYRMNEDDE